MKNAIGIFLLTLVTLLNLKCAKGSGRSRWRRQNIQYVATPRPDNAPVIDVPANSRVTVQMSDGSKIGGRVSFFGNNVIPYWITQAHFIGRTLVFIRMPDGRGMMANLKPPRNPATGLKPISVTVHLLDGSSKNALVQFFDQKDVHTLNHIEGTDTLALVTMPDNRIIYKGFFR